MQFVKRLATLPAGRIGKWIVVVLWIALAAIAGGFAAQLPDVQKNDSRTWLPADAEATRAFDIDEANFGDSDTAYAIVVYSRAGGLTDADKAEVNRDRDAFAPLAKGQVSPLVPSEDGVAALLSVPIGTSTVDSAVLTDGVTKVREVARQGAGGGLEVQVTGEAGLNADLADAFSGIDTTLLLATVIVVAVLLLVTYRSPVLWLIPLISVGIASQVANGVVFLLADNAGLLVNGQSASILPVLVFGVGTDYALLLIARYREELRRHQDRHEAMAVALRRSLPAIAASAVTVILALLCLLAATMNSTRGLGPVAAVGIAVALLAMTTLLPALLVVFGRWIFWPVRPRYQADAAGEDLVADHGVWGRLAGGLPKRPRVLWLGSTLVLIALAFGITTITNGLPRQQLFLGEVESSRGQAILAEHFPAGSSAPLDVFTRAGAATAVADVARATQGVAQVAPPEEKNGWVHLTAVLSDPPDSAAAERTVQRLRDAVHGVSGSDAVVGGSTAITVDTNAATTRDERLIIPLILLVVLVVLIVLLRAVVAPLLLLASVVLSYAAALGAAGLIFNALGYPRIDKSLPLIGFLFLVALGVDYTIFLMTRAREEVALVGHTQGMVRAVAVTGAVITSAGLVLAATFAVLAVLPTVSSLQQGLLVAVGVLLDTFIVRTLLVPALALDVGPRIWWPGRPGKTGVPTVSDERELTPAR